ncbi:DUF2066 domain-containing protein [Alteromonas aestuariivivens]|uniref:DUF2066 domain-containing protein n=1 Tax=Alteromonas aestuariivivens TaxID=1938339 RepID=UPI0011C03813|nr:DUF2066 domain-containing protein [Alteromonas aestuariivivens]
MFSKCAVAALLTMLLAGLAAPTVATEVVETNRAKIPVADQSRESLSRASREALAQVVVKMSGKRDSVKNPVLSAAIRNPTKLLRSYQFEVIDQTLYLVADFDAESIESILRTEGFPIWDQRRPDGLLWLALEQDNGNRVILDEANSRELGQVITTTAEQRGVPVSMPLMDITDSQAISIYDVWGQFASSLTQASQRYGADFVLGARIYRNDGLSSAEFSPSGSGEPGDGGNEQEDALYRALANERQAKLQGRASFSDEEFRAMNANTGEGDYALDWVLIGGDKVHVGTLYGESPVQLSENLLHEYADFLAGKFAIVPVDEPGEASSVEISVANLDSLNRYVEALRYLNSLSVVDAAVLEQQSGSVGTFRLGLIGSFEDFATAVALENHLQPVTDGAGQRVEGKHYYWND